MQLTPSYNPTGAARGIEILILDAQSVDETKSTIVCPGTLRNHTITLKSSASITGAVQIETANDPAYTGVWAPLGGGPIDVSTIGPAAAGELQFQFSNITLEAIRVRIETVIAGGTVSATYRGDK